MAKKKIVKKKITVKPKQIIKVNPKPILQKENNLQDIKVGLNHFVYGMLFGALLMLIIIRIFQIM